MNDPDHFCTGFGCIACVLKPDSEPPETVAQDERGWYPLNDPEGQRFKTKFAALLQAAAFPRKKTP